MDIRHITPDYAVAPQISPDDMAHLAEAGFTTVINNRPDAEVTDDIACSKMRAAAEAAGLAYEPNPVVNGGLTMEMVDRQGEICANAAGPVFAYCRSGTRSSITWALSQAGKRPTPDILADLAQAGYPQPMLGPQIEVLAQR